MGAEEVRDGGIRGFWGRGEGIGDWSDKVRIPVCVRSPCLCVRAGFGRVSSDVPPLKMIPNWGMIGKEEKGALTAPTHPPLRPWLLLKAQKAFKVRVLNPTPWLQAPTFVWVGSYFHVPWELRPFQWRIWSTRVLRSLGQYRCVNTLSSSPPFHAAAFPADRLTFLLCGFSSSSSSCGTLNCTWSRWLCCCRWCGTTSSSYRGRIPGKTWWVARSPLQEKKTYGVISGDVVPFQVEPFWAKITSMSSIQFKCSLYKIKRYPECKWIHEREERADEHYSNFASWAGLIWKTFWLSWSLKLRENSNWKKKKESAIIKKKCCLWGDTFSAHSRISHFAL